MIDNDSKEELNMSLGFRSQSGELFEGICQDFEPMLPGNHYSFCKHATFWIDGQRERTCPFKLCSCSSTYSPILYGIYCNKVGNK